MNVNEGIEMGNDMQGNEIVPWRQRHASRRILYDIARALRLLCSVQAVGAEVSPGKVSRSCISPLHLCSNLVLLTCYWPHTEGHLGAIYEHNRSLAQSTPLNFYSLEPSEHSCLYEEQIS